MYKYNFYNHIISIPEKKVSLLFNALYGGLLELQKNEQDLIKKLSKKDYFFVDDIPKDHHELVNKLISYNFINNSISDEKQSYKDEYLKHRTKIKNKESILALTLAPTMNCNFACKYCFENSVESRVMSEKTANEIVAFVNNELENENIIKNIKTLSVAWFGGEPLLTPHLIKSISKQLIDLAKKYDVIYDSVMITNGSLLSEENNLLFEECKIRDIQITLDGAQKTHDIRRPLKNSSQNGSYYQILKNMTHIPDNVGIEIRINCDKQVWANMNILFDDLEKYEVWPQKRNTVKIHLGFIIKNSNSFFNENEWYFSYPEFVKIEEEFREMKLLRYNNWAVRNNRKLAKKIFKIPVFSFYDCISAAYPGGFVIDSEGYVHKCWENIDKIENRIMHITDPFVPENPKLARWLNTDKFYRKECQDCKFLPICDSSCTKRHVEDPANFHCSSWKYQLEDIIKRQYLEMLEHPDKICFV